MPYHSLAIYYDNQLAENEQKRVPRDNRFANLQDSIEARKWQTMILPMRHSWRRAARPPSNFSLSALHVNRDSCHHLCVEVVLSICIDMLVSISVQR